jgi:MFS family permease
MVLVYLVDRWHTGIDQTTFIYSGLALISAITSFFIMAPLTSRIGLNRLAITACIATGAAMIAITVPSQIGSVWITGGLTTMMGTIALAACPTILSNAVPLERQGRVMGNNQALQVDGESLSAIIGGALAAVTTPLPLIVFGIFLIICGILLLRDSRLEAGRASWSVSANGMSAPLSPSPNGGLGARSVMTASAKIHVRSK